MKKKLESLSASDAAPCSVGLVCPHCGHKITPVVSDEWREKSANGGKKASKHPKRRKDSVENMAAKKWKVMSPKREIYDITNLESWCRLNEVLFTDPRPESRRPLWERAYAGLLKQQDPAASTWCGWRLINSEKMEADQNNHE